MKNGKTLIIIVIALIAFNCAALAFFWIKLYPKQQEQRHPFVPVQGQAFEYLTRQLQLTKVQQRQYQKMREAHRDLADSLNEQSHVLRDSFFAKLKDTSAKPEVANNLAKRIATNTFQLDTATFYHFRRFRKILTTQQQQKFDEIIQYVLRMGGMPRPNPQGAPPQGPPNGPRGRRFHRGQPLMGLPPGSRGRQNGGPLPPNGGPPPYGPPPNGRPPYGPPPGQGPPPGGGPPPNGGPPGGLP